MWDRIDWFQMGALAAYLGATAVRAVQLQKRWGIQAITLGGGRPRSERLIEGGFLILGVVWIAEVVRHALGIEWSWWPHPLAKVIFQNAIADFTGRGLVIIALVMFVAALASFGRSWRIGIDHQHPGKLVTRGIFSLSRNPIFLSLDLLFLGFFLINPTPVMLLLFLAMAVGAHVQILNEERFLHGQYGASYEEYRRRTRRYL